MPPVARSRSMSFGDTTSSWTYLGTPGTTTRSIGSKQCDDVVGNFGEPNPLTITETKRGGSLLNWDGSLQCDSKPCSIQNRAPSYNGPQPATYINRILSQTGPLTPDVYLPLSIFELRELPQLVKYLGDLGYGIKDAIRDRGPISPGKGVAEWYITAQFGVAPVVQDILKLLTFAAMVRKRQRMLRDAHSKKGIRRRVKLDEGRLGPNFGVLAVNSTQGAVVWQDYESYTDFKTWATVTWTVRDPSQVGKTPSFDEAFRIALGLNKGYIPIMVWKALPWTWMTDWFLNISQILQANHNRIYYKPGKICIMRQTVGVTSFAAQSNINGKPKQFITGGEVRNVSKTRTVHAPNNNVNLRMPFLDPFKLSILGSLAVLKAR